MSPHLFSRKAGFTLIEVLVVLGIVIILYALISPAVFSARERSKETGCISNLHQIGLALQMYQQDTGDYPNQPPQQLVKTGYVKDKSILICPQEYRNLAQLDETSPGLKSIESSYTWPCVPTDERDEVYAKRGEQTPLVFCAVHMDSTFGEPHVLVLRHNGAVNRVGGAALTAAQTSWDY